MTKFVTHLLLIGIVVSTNSCTKDQDILPDNKYIIGEGNRPLVIAHGGAKELWPENTMIAFDGSVGLGVDMLEMDVKITKDSVLVCHHDDDIKGMSNGSGKVSSFTYSELLDYNFGYYFKDLDGNYPFQTQKVEITRLEDVFNNYFDYLFTVEIKDTEDHGKLAAEKLLELIEKFDLSDQIIVACFDEETLEYFRTISEQKVPVSASQKETTKFVLSAKAQSSTLYHPHAVAFQIPVSSSIINLDRKHIIKAAHRHNMAVHYWTINDKEEMRNLIEKGADGLITDRPDIMLDLLKEMGW
ncbi:MAG: glycerophosphodiester phosphodiesterase [Bacteroidetes bacterium]|nr:glycerophosphodiester phosphodiesterase [Bacteroidota bacterium]